MMDGGQVAANPYHRPGEEAPEDQFNRPLVEERLGCGGLGRADPDQYLSNGLQWGRGIAALAVVFAHALGHPLPELSELARLLGILGVTLFFVISGFIMVATTGRARFDPLAFMTRRLLRIAPLYYLLTCLTAVLVLALPSFFKHTVFEPGHFLKSLLFIPDFRLTCSPEMSSI